MATRRTPPPGLRRELGDLGLVAAGAIPGALLRWRLEILWQTRPLGWAGPVNAAMAANLAGCLLIGLLGGARSLPPGWLLVGGIGFCGSLTTFSGWILTIERELRGGAPEAALTSLLLSLGAGLLAVAAGHRIGRVIGRRRCRRGSGGGGEGLRR